MSARQIEVCANRIPEADAERFMQMLADAAVLSRQAVELRTAAWALYRHCTGAEKQPSHKKKKVKA